jgi:hypothetical protein
MALIVGGGVDVDFNNAKARVFRVSGHPFGGYEYFWMRIVRHSVPLQIRRKKKRVAQMRL